MGGRDGDRATRHSSSDEKISKTEFKFVSSNNSRTRDVLWKVHLGAQIRAGAALADGILYLPYKSGDIAAIRAADGTHVSNKHIGGAFGPPSPVIVGGTQYVSNIYGWVLAMPVSEIRGSTKLAREVAHAR